MSEINVVPYIDVMLVLLVIFMVTAPLITTGILDLPEVSKTAPKKETVVTIEIRKNELFKIKLTGDKKVITVTKSTLVEKIKEIVNAEENLAVVISAEKNVTYNKVLETIEALNMNGISRVGLLVKKKNLGI
jgi:biopolymer transport protein TolR